ncbi:bifunctional diguanylate cyclase/phosphodiesterase [Lysobacter sp. A289]
MFDSWFPGTLPGAAGNAADWRTRMVEAVTVLEVASVLVGRAGSLPGVRRARLFWELDFSQPMVDQVPAPDPRELALMDDAGATGAPSTSADGRHLAIPLPASTAVMLLELAPSVDIGAITAQLASALRVVDRKLDRRLRMSELEGEVVRLQLSEQVQRALFAISELAGSDRDMAEVLRGIHRIVGTLMHAENFFIVMRDLELDTLRLIYFADVKDPQPFDELPLDEVKHSATWYVIRDRKALRGDNERLRAQASGPMRLVGSDSPAWLGVPMLREGVAHGAIVVQSYQQGIGYSEANQTLLEFVASHILTTLERKSSTELLERSVKLRTQELAQANCDLQFEVAERERTQQLQTALFQIAQLAVDDIDENQFYRRIHGIIGQLLNAENLFIALLSDDGSMLEFPYHVDPHSKDWSMSRPLARGLSEYVLRTRQPLLATATLLRELEHRGEIEHHPGFGFPSESWLGVPLISGDETIGLVAVQSYDPAVSYNLPDQELLGFVASQIANSLHRRRVARFRQQAYEQLEDRVDERTVELREQIRERERIQQQLRHEVMHDALTGLPNRSHLRERIEAALAQMAGQPKRRCALLYLDVDRFKVINDSLGHLAGDAFLREIACRLQASVRKPDLVARLSGDEFAVLLNDIPPDGGSPRSTPTAVAQRVLDLITAPMEIAGRTLEPSASIGIAIGNKNHTQADELIRDADAALYRAKALGRKRWQMFDDSLQRSAVDVLTIEAELRQALLLDQLEPYLQPIVRLTDGKVVGHEALLRWNHPRRGVLCPGDFLQVAEDSGLIQAIDWRVFKRSMVHMAAMDDDTYLTINVAPRHLRQKDFAKRLLRLVSHTGMSPTRLVIEITEGSLLDDPEHMRAVLDHLLASGVRTALDDFGTGYSSLSYLHTFPLRMLKIDRTFLAALGKQSNTAPVVSAVIALARALDMVVVAEGVETEEQHRILIALGCELGQGYLLGRPSSFADDLPDPSDAQHAVAKA